MNRSPNPNHPIHCSCWSCVLEECANVIALVSVIMGLVVLAAWLLDRLVIRG